ncbi:hypothetical protein CR513_50609, partial [Mucuna pruriens]
MLDQLHKTPAQISLLSLLINSESHHELLLKVLNNAHILHYITPEKFGGIINNITASRHLSFSKEEVSTKGRSHNQSLHIVQIQMLHDSQDNGFSLNVMLKATLNKLYFPSATLKISPLVVRAFDGSKREVMGKITLPIRIGPKTFDVTFQVMDIRPAYSCLLGKPLIHAAGAVLSSLHQKVKFIVDGQLISVMGEKELIINTPFLEALETSFQALEIVGTANTEVEGGDPKPSRVAIMAAKVLISNGFQPGKGLGRELHYIAEPIDNATLTFDNAGKSSRLDEGDDLEEEALEELERVLEQERPRLQSGVKVIKVINLGKEGEIKEIRVGKLMLPDLRQRLVELLRGYVNIFV